ncbi:hypothetical protein JY96_21550 [Aquabacterium sp. NJ1]|nr:hypothetical protein JY96_21550 [Aquabacterium sp. NJ1]
MRQIDVVVDRKVSDTPDASLCGGVGQDEVMSEEIVYIETFDVDVRDLEEAMPVEPCNAKPLLFTGKVFDSKRTFSA